MAFDLSVTAFKPDKTGERARDKLQKLIDRSGCESWGRDTDSVGVGIGRLTEKQAARFYTSLVKLAAQNALTIYDPQAGEEVDLVAPGRLPPGWRALEPVDEKQFGKSIQAYVRRRLKPLGYRPNPWGAQRLVGDEHLLQRLTFSLDKGLLAVSIDWRFFFDGKEDESWPAPLDLGDYIVGTALEAEWPVALTAPRWGRLSATKSDLAASLDLVDRALNELVHPVLDSITTIESLIAAYEDDRLGAVAHDMKDERKPLEAIYVAFGCSPIATARNMALSYRHVGRLAEGRRRFESVSSEVRDWLDLLAPSSKEALSAALALFD